MPVFRHSLQPFGDRLTDRIIAVNPDVWLAGAVLAVMLPWLSRLV